MKRVAAVHLRPQHRQLHHIRRGLQDVHGARDGRPLAAVGVSAPEPHDQRALHLHLHLLPAPPPLPHHLAAVVVVVALPPHQPLVHRLGDGVPAVEAPHPPRQHEELVAVVGLLHGAAAGDELQEDDAEAVDVRHGAGAARVDELRVDVARRAQHHLRRRRPHAVVDQPRQAEVAQLGVQRGVQHDVARLDVTVHYALLPLRVEVPQRRPQTHDDLVPVDDAWVMRKKVFMYIYKGNFYQIIQYLETRLPNI